MSRVKLSIGQKIFGAFLIMIILLIINAFFAIVTFDKNEGLVLYEKETGIPIQHIFHEWQQLCVESQMLTTFWINNTKVKGDKQRLRHIIKNEYPQLRKRIPELADKWQQEKMAAQIPEMMTATDTLFSLIRKITNKLSDDDKYNEGNNFYLSNKILENEIRPLSDKLLSNLNRFEAEAAKANAEKSTELVESYGSLRSQTTIISIISVLLGLSFAFVMSRNITEPIENFKELIKDLSRGVLPEENNKFVKREDEIGEMAEAVNTYVEGIRRTSEFAEAIGNSDFQSDFIPLSEEDILGNALISMRNNLQRNALEENERTWINTGLTKINDILKQSELSISELTDRLIRTTIKYLEANQGGLFVVNDEQAEKNQQYLDLLACYAWGRKKYLKQKVSYGEGLTGQAWREGGITNLTEVPSDYISITSGLGGANPGNILIVPLMLNELSFGLIELASFQKFEDKHIEFLKKAGENIASTLSILKNSEQSQKLISNSQEMMQQLSAQEEEMRQNMEELTATQEGMQRVHNELRNRNAVFEESFMVLEADSQQNIIEINQLASEKFGFNRHELIGKPLTSIFSDEVKVAKAYRAMDKNIIWNETLPLLDKKQQPHRVSIFGKSLRDLNSKTVNYIFVLLDLSRESELIKEVEERNKEVERIKSSAEERAKRKVEAQQKVLEKMLDKIRREKEAIAKAKGEQNNSPENES